MHLNHNFCSNPRHHIQGLGISLLIFYTFFSKEIKTFRWISSEFWSELVGYESGFLINLLITTIWENSHLSPSFFDYTSSIPYPCYFPFLFIPVSILLWNSPESLSLSSWLVRVLRFGKFCKVWWFTSLLQCVSVTDFLNRVSY